VRRIRIENVTRDELLAAEALLADTFLTRFRGLLGRPQPGPGEGLVLRPCDSVHMFGMTYALDVIFAASDGEVLRVVRDLRPWRLTWPCPRAEWTVELAPGAAAGTRAGDELRFTVVGG
jgi:uncharacterized protein